MTGAIMVICKSPRPGKVKTRLCPPFSAEQAAQLAEASLRDTLQAVLHTKCGRRVVALEGVAGPWLPEGFDVIEQRGDGLGARLAFALEDVGEPALVIGMDTPQVDGALLESALGQTLDAGSSLGRARDGGYWAIGLTEPVRGLFDGVPMSTSNTHDAQLTRMRQAGLSPALLTELVDFDDLDSAHEVSAKAPRTRFASELARIEPGSVTA